MSGESHTILDGKVHVYRRENSRFWQCAVFLGGRNHRQSTRQESLVLALDFAHDWYLDRYADERLRRRGITVSSAAAAEPQARPAAPPPAVREKTFREAATAFTAEYEVITLGERNASYVASKSRQLRLYLLPFFGDRPLSEVTAGLIQEYRVHRLTPPERHDEAVVKGRQGRKATYKRPARNTLHQEMVTLRQVLKTANRKGWLPALPDMSAPYKQSGKITHRAWFSPAEYKLLYEATRERARNPKNERWRGECEQFHDYVLFMVNTGLRPDEASRLEYRDVAVVVDADTGERILEIEVRGKRGVGYCKSMPGAVQPFLRMRKRNDPREIDLIFGKVQRELMNAILEELGLKKDRDGNVRTAYSLRHTYICLRLMEGADIYQIAKNCRTSVEMIETYYASHIKNTLDAAAINVRKKPRKAPSAQKALANAKAPRGERLLSA
ncbi:MAG TPA: site-specific integrase [Caulobacteraceae bacterium]|nr:site-specific integrase [Caulobacteraceae bacterium]